MVSRLHEGMDCRSRGRTPEIGENTEFNSSQTRDRQTQYDVNDRAVETYSNTDLNASD